ncbi:unnamed protein product, partial [Symbiodinium sp. CCMP2456]
HQHQLHGDGLRDLVHGDVDHRQLYIFHLHNVFHGHDYLGHLHRQFEHHLDVQLDLHDKHQRDYNYHCNNIHHLVDSYHEHLNLHHVFKQYNDNQHFNNFHIDVCNIDD